MSSRTASFKLLLLRIVDPAHADFFHLRVEVEGGFRVSGFEFRV